MQAFTLRASNARQWPQQEPQKGVLRHLELTDLSQFQKKILQICWQLSAFPCWDL